MNLLIPELKERHKTMILEATATTAYQENHAGPAIERLVCDDAKQFYYIPHFSNPEVRDTLPFFVPSVGYPLGAMKRDTMQS